MLKVALQNTYFRSVASALAALSLAAALTACSGPRACGADGDCKDDLVCVSGTCQKPGQRQGPVLQGPDPQRAAPAPSDALRSPASTLTVKADFINRRGEPVKLMWLDFQGIEKPYGAIAPGQQMPMDTYVGHVWIFRNATTGEAISRWAATSQAAATVEIR